MNVPLPSVEKISDYINLHKIPAADVRAVYEKHGVKYLKNTSPAQRYAVLNDLKFHVAVKM